MKFYFICSFLFVYKTKWTIIISGVHSLISFFLFFISNKSKSSLRLCFQIFKCISFHFNFPCCSYLRLLVSFLLVVLTLLLFFLPSFSIYIFLTDLVLSRPSLRFLWEVHVVITGIYSSLVNCPLFIFVC